MLIKVGCMILRLRQIFQSPLGSPCPSEFLIPTKGTLGIFISNKPPGQADATGPGDPTLKTTELDIVVAGLQLPFLWLCSHLRYSGITFSTDSGLWLLSLASGISSDRWILCAGNWSSDYSLPQRVAPASTCSGHLIDGSFSHDSSELAPAFLYKQTPSLKISGRLKLRDSWPKLSIPTPITGVPLLC